MIFPINIHISAMQYTNLVLNGTVELMKFLKVRGAISDFKACNYVHYVLEKRGKYDMLEYLLGEMSEFERKCLQPVFDDPTYLELLLTWGINPRTLYVKALTSKKDKIVELMKVWFMKNPDKLDDLSFVIQYSFFEKFLDMFMVLPSAVQDLKFIELLVVGSVENLRALRKRDPNLFAALRAKTPTSVYIDLINSGNISTLNTLVE